MIRQHFHRVQTVQLPKPRVPIVVGIVTKRTKNECGVTIHIFRQAWIPCTIFKSRPRQGDMAYFITVYVLLASGLYHASVCLRCRRNNIQTTNRTVTTVEQTPGTTKYQQQSCPRTITNARNLSDTHISQRNPWLPQQTYYSGFKAHQLVLYLVEGFLVAATISILAVSKCDVILCSTRKNTRAHTHTYIHT